MADEVASSYALQLQDLKMNSKPVINVLTMMAEDYIRSAPIVVQTIEKHLARVHPGLKLPTLYLIDSIVKNVKKDYINLFTQNIDSTFTGVFEKVDEKVKSQMFKLRQTWNEVFPQRKLYAIDVRCHQLDKNWPISQPPANASIHVNPKFLNAPSRSPSSSVSAGSSPGIVPALLAPNSVPAPVGDVTEAEMREKLLEKQMKLLELQQKKIELELMQAKAALETKRLEDLEKGKQNNQKLSQLLEQAEKAKSKTEAANHILANYQVPVASIAASSGTPSTASVASPPPVVNDPRLLRQMENKAKSEAATATNTKSKVKSPTPEKFKSADVSPHKQVPKGVDKDGKMDGKDSIVLQQPFSVIEDPRRKKSDIVEINMFNDKKTSKRSESKDRHVKDSSDKDRGFSKDKKSKDQSTAERSRSPDRKKSSKDRKSTTPSKEKSSKRKHEAKESADEDFEDEMKGYSGLTIKPNRSSNADGKNFSKESSNKKNKHHESPTSSSGKKTEIIASNNSSQNSSPSSSPRKRSRTSSERSDKDTKTGAPDRRDSKTSRHEKAEKDKRSPAKGRSSRDKEETDTKWRDYRERQKAVLKRTYRKTPGVSEADEAENKEPIVVNLDDETIVTSVDVDLRFQGRKDVDLRSEVDSKTEPPAKKSRGGNNFNSLDQLFGRQDVDLRPPRSGSWSQDKNISPTKRETNSGRPRRGISSEEEEAKDTLTPQRPPVPLSPANSVASDRSSHDPLGRPLLYNKLPEDPEERKRSLDLKLQTIDPVDDFRRRYIDVALSNSKGVLSQLDITTILSKAQEYLDQGLFATEQYLGVMKQIQLITEANAVREVQQLQMSSNSSNSNWQAATGPNPWAGATANQWFNNSATPSLGFPMGPNAWAPNSMGMPGIQWETPLPGPKGPNPFEEALIDDLIPIVNEAELRVADRDTPSCIPIDKIMRQLRFYGETALILMGQMADEPKEISFQRDGRVRTVFINRMPVEICIGDTKPFEWNRKTHTLRLGAPTRELFIDEKHYEICFGGPPIKVNLDGRLCNVELKGAPPQVELGKVCRYDLLAGRVNLIVDAVKQVIVYLDEKPQKLDLFSEPVILRFCENFRTVLLNGRPFPTNFGARLPFTVTIPNAGKHYLRFSALTPSAEKAIGSFIRAKTSGGVMEIEDSNSGGSDSFGMRTRGRGRGGGGRRGFGRHESPNDFMPQVSDKNPLDAFTNLFQSPRAVADASAEETRRFRKDDKRHSYESDQVREEGGTDQANEAASGTPDVTNLLALAAKLGLLPSNPAPMNKKADREEEIKAGEEVEPAIQQEQRPEKPSVPPLETVSIDLSSDAKDNLKERREKLIAQLWTGIQCASCGLRFPPDQTDKYCQHLDWHFRYNRRQKATAKKALSRKWYYDLSDWIQFEEIEDLEERAESLFKIQEETENEAKSPDAVPEEYSVLASTYEGAICPQCTETFSSYYDEDREEWRLKDALLDEAEEGNAKIYHPACYQDYMKSLNDELMDVGDEKEEKETSEPDTNNSVPQEDEDEVLILKEGKKEVVLMEIDVDDNDDECKEKNIDNDNFEKKEIAEKSPIYNSDSSSLPVNLQSSNISTEKIPVPSFSVISKPVSSPIVIEDEDSSSRLLPGISEDSTGGVFGFALNSGRRERSESPVSVDEKRIVYKSMEFDFPRIKLEPPDELPEENVEEPIDLMFSQTTDVSTDLAKVIVPEISVDEAGSPKPSSSVGPPLNIDLTGDDSSSDEVDSGPVPIGQMTAIDGNLNHEVSAPIIFPPVAKIRINFTGMDLSSSKSPPTNKEREATPPKETGPESSKNNGENGLSETEKSKGDKSPVSSDNKSESNKPEAEIVFTEEMKRLKPRLVGKKLVNCPPKKVGREESGLCVIS